MDKSPLSSHYFVRKLRKLRKRERSKDVFGKLLVMLLGVLLANAVQANPVATTTTYEPLHVFAAGSLKGAFTSIIAEWQRIHPDQPVSLTSGPAGWLRKRIEHGEAFDIYASAALTHAEAVHSEGWAGSAVLFAHNRLCATVKADSPLTSQTLVAAMLLPTTRIATSTPKSDPGGDYTWEFFHRLDQHYPGAFAELTARARQVYGGTPDPNNRPRSIATLITEGEFDIAIGYCSGVVSAGRVSGKDATVKAVPLPDAPIADYGLVVSCKARASASEFVLFVLSPTGQRVLSDHGFISVGLPSD